MTSRIPLSNPMARAHAKRQIDAAPDGYVVTIQEPTRTLAQNARLWDQLDDISKQVEWYGRRLSPEEWKHIFSAAIRKQDVVPNLDGTGFVVLGQSTSKMRVREMSDMLELMNAFCAERGVKLSAREWEAA